MRLQKNKRKKFLKLLEDLPMKTFKMKVSKNNRGDYGYNESFFDGLSHVFTISIDGARQDVQIEYNEKYFNII